jgi:hypothetical protein
MAAASRHAGHRHALSRDFRIVTYARRGYGNQRHSVGIVCKENA